MRTRSFDNRGQILWVAMLLLLTLVALPILFQVQRASSKQNFQSQYYDAIGKNQARGAVEMALAWFRNQNADRVSSLYDPVSFPYPDAAFAPKTSTSTAACCTSDESVGLVSEKLLDAQKNLWVRLEVRRQALDPATNPRDPLAARDISAYYGGVAGEGRAWAVTGQATLYVRVSSAVPYNQSPNRRVAGAKDSAEFRFVELNLPAPAAVWSNNVGNVTGHGTIVGGDGIGIAGNSGTVVFNPTTLSGSPASQIVATTPTVQSILGVSVAEFKELAQTRAVFGAGSSSDYKILPTNTLEYKQYKPGIAGNTTETFSSDSPRITLLESTNDLTWSGSFIYSGFGGVGVIIWNSSKTLTLNMGRTLSGAMVSTGGGQIRIVDPSAVFYSPNDVEHLRSNVAGYNSTWKPREN